MKKVLVIILIGIGVIALLIGSNYLVTEYAFGPSKEVKDAMRSDNMVKVDYQENKTWLVFSPVEKTASVGLIMYPENYQDIRMYAPISREIAKAGYQIILLSRREKFPLTPDEEVVRVQTVMKAYPQITQWFIGAHTWEAAIAAYYARKFPDTLTGVVLWAGRLYSDVSLADTKLPVLMVYGTKDDKNENLVATNKPFLPEQTLWVEIQGGNRVNFANFGPMPRDVAADIPMIEQQTLAVQSTVDFMANSLK